MYDYEGTSSTFSIIDKFLCCTVKGQNSSVHIQPHHSREWHVCAWSHREQVTWLSSIGITLQNSLYETSNVRFKIEDKVYIINKVTLQAASGMASWTSQRQSNSMFAVASYMNCDHSLNFFNTCCNYGETCSWGFLDLRRVFQNNMQHYILHIFTHSHYMSLSISIYPSSESWKLYWLYTVLTCPIANSLQLNLTTG